MLFGYAPHWFVDPDPAFYFYAIPDPGIVSTVLRKFLNVYGTFLPVIRGSVCYETMQNASP